MKKLYLFKGCEYLKFEFSSILLLFRNLANFNMQIFLIKNPFKILFFTFEFIPTYPFKIMALLSQSVSWVFRGVFLFPPGWDANPLPGYSPPPQGSPPALNLPVAIYMLWESHILPRNTIWWPLAGFNLRLHNLLSSGSASYSIWYFKKFALL